MWRKYGNSCYYVGYGKSWDSAELLCKTMTSDLIKIETADERTWVLNWIKQIKQSTHTTTRFWTGLRNKNTAPALSFTWTDGSARNQAVRFTNTFSANSKCGILDGNIFINANCNRTNGFICERHVGIPLTCKSFRHWLSFNNFCYKIYSNTSETWDNAQKVCDSHGGNLFTVESPPEEGIIEHFAQSTGKNYWLGVKSYPKKSSYQWLTIPSNNTLSASLSYWKQQPNLQSNQYNNSCVYVLAGNVANQAWQAINCNSRQNFVCKKSEGTCQPGWVAHQNKCYQFNTHFLMSWQQSVQFCNSQGGRLVESRGKPATDFINSYLGDLKKSGIDSIWIGATDNNTNTYTWSTGHNMTKYQHWASNPPANTPNRQDCVYINTVDTNGLWQTTPDCAHNRGFICTIPFDTQVLTVTTPRPTYKCDDHWNLNSGVCFQFNDSSADWMTARRSCQNQGGDLAIVDTNDKHTFIANKIGSGVYWIGLNDQAVNGQYTWIQSGAKTLLFKWCPNEPNDAHTGENCVGYWTRGSKCWNDFLCNYKIKYICQKPPQSIPLGPPITTTPIPFSVRCGPGWEERPSSQYCYQFHDDQLSWYDARSACKSVGGDLASIHSRDEQAYIKSRIASMTSIALWLGFTDLTKEGSWQWSDGTPVQLLDWAAGEPNQYKNREEDCMNMYTTTKAQGWNDFPCNKRNGFICKKSYGSITTPTPRPTPHVPDGMYLGCHDFWKQHGRYCWHFMTRNITAADARAECQKSGGYLASISNEDEQNFMAANIPKPMKYFKGGSIWIGLSDTVVENYFVWDDKTPVTYTHWEYGEPNNWRKLNEDCTAVWLDDGYWFDYVCTSISQGYVCKKGLQIVSSTGQDPITKGCDKPFKGFGYGSSCYAFRDTHSDKPLSWQAAQQSCKTQFGGQLATVNDRYVQSFIASYIRKRDGYFWIGLSDQKTLGTYSWIQGQTDYFTYWYKTHTGNELGTCVAMRTTNPVGLWENKNCSEPHNYICETPRTGYTKAPTTLAPVTPCASGWLPFNSWCYKVFHKRGTYVQARDYCQSIGANLVSIHSKAETDFLVSKYGQDQGYHSYWIGFTDFDKEGSWVWSDKSASNYANWNRGEPNNSGGSEDCTQIYLNPRQSGKWNDIPCFSQMEFICKAQKGTRINMITTPKVPSATAASSLCGSGTWYSFGGSCYMPSPTQGRNSSLTWYDAQSYCNANGADLANIHSKTENQFVFGMVRKTNKQEAWVGLNELQLPGKYQWSTNDKQKQVLNFVSWLPNEPNNDLGGERCVTMEAFYGNWKDENCNYHMGFVCKKPIHGTGTITPKPTPLIKGGCAQNFIPEPYGNKCFYISKGAPLMTWDQALKYCTTNFGPGYQMASISNEIEQAFLTSLVQGLTKHTWIGLNCKKQFRQFVWQDNSPVKYTNWNGGEPNGNWRYHNDPVKGESCVEMYVKGSTAGEWNDKPCINKRYAICQGLKVQGQQIPSSQGNCKSGYISYRTSCYKFVKSPVQTWQNAEQTCSADGGVLVSVNDKFENSFIESQMGPNLDYWIGLQFSRMPGNNNFAWQKQWPVVYTNWGYGEPSQGPTDQCVKSRNGQWDDTDCSKTMGYVCEINSVGPPAATPVPASHCLHGDDVQRGDYCYYFSPRRYLSWPSARYVCQRRLMDLVSISSADELKFVLTYMVNLRDKNGRSIAKNIWIGLNKGLSSGFQWSDNSAFSYSNWNPGQPSDPINSTIEECVSMYRSNGWWNDQRCSISQTFICKGRAFLDTSTIPVKTPSLPNGPVTNKPGMTGPVTNKAGVTNPPTGPTNQPGTVTHGVKGPKAQTSNKKNSGISGGGVAGVVIAVLLVLGLGVGFGLIYWKKGNPLALLRRGDSDGFSNKLYKKDEETTTEADA